jgi:hypothetical protein
MSVGHLRTDNTTQTAIVFPLIENVFLGFTSS